MARQVSNFLFLIKVMNIHCVNTALLRRMKQGLSGREKNSTSGLVSCDLRFWKLSVSEYSIPREQFTSYTHIGANGHASHAFVLAEKYRDFRCLASLCHKGTTYPPEDNPNAARIQSYVEKFKEEFTTELYRWYIEHGSSIPSSDVTSR